MLPTNKNAHRKAECLNCAEPLKYEDRFCPQCGQANNDFRLSVSELFAELFRNVFNLDSRLSHSLKPFLIKPGFLPRAFLEGKRVRYVHPIRFYLFSSIFFFFVFSQQVQPLASEMEKLYSKFDKTLGAGMPPKEMDKHLEATSTIIDKAVRARQLDSLKGREISQSLETIDTKAIFYSSQEERDTSAATKKRKSVASINGHRVDWEKLTGVWLKDPDMTATALLDSLQVQEQSWLAKKMAEQALKYGQFSEPKLWLRNVLDNIPIMMFLLLPLFAGILKLMYIRSSCWYIDHLIFTLHIHAYIFIVTGIYFIFNDLLGENGVLILLGLLIVYPFLMFKNFYRQGFVKTFLKFLFIGGFYFTLLVLAAVLEMLISFMLI